MCVFVVYARTRDLSPCKEIDMPNTSSSTLSDRPKRNDSSAQGGSSTSALDRLRYNLSPVASYYKPLIRSFGRRDESPAKVSMSTGTNRSLVHHAFVIVILFSFSFASSLVGLSSMEEDE